MTVDPNLDIDDLAVRAAAARDEADTTPAAPTGSWRVRSEWQPIDAAPSDITIGEERFGVHGDGFAGANRLGRHTSCCAGVLRVWVYGPDGTVYATYDRSNGFWIRHVEDDDALS